MIFLALLGIYYEISSDLKTLRIKGNNEETTQKGVRSKGDYSRIENTIIEEGIVSIGSSSFFQCSSLLAVSLPSSLRQICSNAFKNSGIRSLNIPEGVSTLQNRIFYECFYLENITIPSTATSISTTQLFLGCSKLAKFYVSENNPKYSSMWQNQILIEDGVTAVCCSGAYSTVEVPSSIRTIGPSFAENMNNIKNVTFPSNSALTKILSGAFIRTSLTEIILPSNLETVGDNICQFVPTLYKIFIPKSLVEVSDIFLTGTKLTEIVIEDECPSLKLINGILYDYNITKILYVLVSLKNISIGRNISFLANEVLQRCQLLEKVELDQNNLMFQEHNSVIYINNFSQLYSCPGGLKNVTVHEKCTSFLMRSFRDTLIEEVHFAGNIFHTIGLGTFALCKNLKILDIPLSLTTIQSHGIAATYLQGYQMKLNSKLNKIGEYAWTESNISSVDFSDSTELKTIPQYCFSKCIMLTKIILPPNLESIGSFAMEECESLTSISIPNQTRSILDSAFQLCKSLSNVTFEGISIIDKINSLVFSNCDLEEIFIPDSVLGIDSGSFLGNQNLKRINFSDTSLLRTIGTGAFSNCSMITSIKIGRYVTDIAIGALSNMKGLLEIDVDSENSVYSSVNGALFSKNESSLWCCPGGLTEASIGGKLERIEGAAFMGCSKLMTLMFEGETKLKTIAAESFVGCTALESIRIPSSVTDILENAFEGCSGLASVSFIKGSLLQSISSGSFGGCSELTNVIFEGESSLTEISDNAFQGCSKLQRCDFPSSLKSIGDSAFFGCASLKNITLNEGLVVISGNSFSGCTSITDVFLPSSLKSLGSGAFGSCKNLKYVRYCGVHNLSLNMSFGECPDLLYAEVSFRYSFKKVGGIVPRIVFDESCHIPTGDFTLPTQLSTCISLLVEVLEASESDESNKES